MHNKVKRTHQVNVKSVLVSVLLGFQSLLIAPSGLAQQPVTKEPVLESLKSTGEERFALVIGNGHYQSAGLNLKEAADIPIHDAIDMKTRLESIGFKVITKYDLTQQGIKDAITEFKAMLPASQRTALFYYSGHGAQLSSTNYLLPVEARLVDEESIINQGVNLNEVLGVLDLDEGKGGVNIVLLDACRNKPRVRTKSGDDITQGLAAITPPRETMIGYATRANQKSIAGTGDNRNSPYTEALLKFIPTQGLSIGNFFIEVGKYVKKKTDSYQIPDQYGNLTEYFYFVKPTPEDVAMVWKADNSSLGHNYGHLDNGEWVATPSEAVGYYLSFGPYAKLSPGKYKVSFLYRCMSDKKTAEKAIELHVSTFDPKTGAQNVIKFLNVPLAACNNDISVSSWIFDVTEADAAKYTYEFRVYSYRNAEIRLKEIRLEKILN
jgi:hypothetical protein